MQQEHASEAVVSRPNAVRIGVSPSNDPLFEIYRWANVPAFEIDAYDRTERRDCNIEARVLLFSDMLIARARSSALTYQRTERVIARGGISDFLVEIYVSDRVSAKIEGRDVQIRAGDIIILDLTRPCELSAGQHEVVVVTLRRSEIERFVSNIDDLHGTVLKADLPLARMLKAHILLVETEAKNLEADDSAPIVRSSAALVGHCFGAKAHDARQGQAAIAFSLFNLVRRNIDKMLDDPNLNVDFLARRHGVSRSSLYRMFEPHGGVNTFIRQRRLRRICGDLSDPLLRDQRIATIAYRWGFTSEVTFSKTFKAAFGISARDFRASLTRGEMPVHRLDNSDRNEFRRLRNLLDEF